MVSTILPLQTQNSLWLRLDINPENTFSYKYPEVEILRITKDSIFLNEFDETVEVAPVLSKEEYLNRNMAVPEFYLKKENVLIRKLTFRDEDNKHITMESVHIKLVPTKIAGSNLLEEIIKNRYEGTINKVNNVLVFDTKIHIDGTPHITRNQILGDELKLEHYLDSYFLSFYLQGSRFHVIPIYEITKNTITIYGYNEHNEMSTFTAI